MNECFFEKKILIFIGEDSHKGMNVRFIEWRSCEKWRIGVNVNVNEDA